MAVKKIKSRASISDEAISGRFGSRVKLLRATHKWSLDQLADASGVSKSMLSQIERNNANPTIAVAFRIAQALGMSLAELVEDPRATSNIRVVRSDDRMYHYRTDKDCSIRTLSPLDLEKDVEIYELRLKEGGALRSSAHFEGTREFVTVQSGRVRIDSGNDSEELNRGDSGNYRADQPHAVVNLSRGDAVALLVVVYR
ncbi:MAG: helix-turn-helix transcriptional regulator [Verrucomicrobia bacterium]|nr:helix-turn-helix transcriptional regulator [Verrucomicrobiota bacterium]